MKTLNYKLFLIGILQFVYFSQIRADYESQQNNDINVLITKALNDNTRVVNLEKNKTYNISTSIFIPSDFTIEGNGATLKGRIQKTVTGIKPLTVIRIKQGNNIVIRNLNIDGGYVDQSFSKATDIKDISNVVDISNVSNIRIENMTLKNCTGNWMKNMEPFFSAMSFKNCRAIAINNFNLLNFITEGLVFFDSKDITIQNSSFNSKSGWTPIHFWYCDNIFSKNIVIQNSIKGGTGINGAYSNAFFSNIHIKGGKGIQFSNELNIKSYKCYNLIFENCDLECEQFGIARINYDNTLAQDINILNSKIKVTRAKLSQHNAWGVRLDNTVDAKIDNCEFDIPHDRSSSISISNSSNIYFTNNHGSVAAVAHIYLNNFNVENINISNNTFVIVNTYSTQNSIRGNGSFIYCRNDVDANRMALFKSLTCNNNFIYNIQGAVFMTFFNNPNIVKMKNINFANNEFRTNNKSSMEYGINAQNVENFNFERNIIDNPVVQFIAKTQNITIISNTIKFDHEQFFKKNNWIIRDCSGLLRINGNKIINPISNENSNPYFLLDNNQFAISIIDKF